MQLISWNKGALTLPKILSIRASGIAASTLILFGSAPLLFAGVAHASDVTYFAPSAPSDSNQNWPSGTSYTNNYGVAFLTGSGIPLIDWVKIGLNTSSSTSGDGTIKIALRDTTNSTPYSAVAGTTGFALDTVSFKAPTTTQTNFELTLDSSKIPNIASYVLSPSTTYALILYDRTGGSWGLQRKTNYASGTTNNFYTTSNGFVALNTFRNNSTYSSGPSSYPTLDISFGATSSPPTEVPGPLPLLGVGAAFGWSRRLRKRIHVSITKEPLMLNETGEELCPPLPD